MSRKLCGATGRGVDGEHWQCVADKFHLGFHVSEGGHLHTPSEVEIRDEQFEPLLVLALREPTCIQCGHAVGSHAIETDRTSDRFGQLTCECRRCLLMFWASHGAVCSKMTH